AAMKRPGFEADRFGVMVLDLSTGQSREIAPHWDRSAQDLAWSPDGKTLYVTADELGQAKLFAMDVATGRTAALTDQGHVSGPAPIPGGGILVQRDALDSPAQLWRIPGNGGAGAQLTHVDADKLAGVELVPGEQFSFAGWNNETVHGYVVKPDGLQPGRKYPVAFLVHGGPQGSFGNDWSYRWNPQFYAGLGYAAVMIDFHGSTGYGQKFTDAISGHWGDRPLEDLKKGWAAALVKYPFLDAGHACALGASYGGFMINWIAGNWPEPFKCLVTHDGVFDDRMMGFSTEELWFSEWEHGGPNHTPWSDPAAYERFNPAAHVSAWRDPQLIIHGALDYRIPLEQGLGAFDALQRRGIPSRLLVFPHENHWVLKPADSLQWHATVADWLHRYLDPR
ncbi:MAG: S9 family peptidase, partial [Gluconacetobacter diazotrophicus]|nr:S9 family peptidase [Gluconacetobacter diazotrophicus]